MTLDDHTRARVEEALGHTFKDAGLVEQALTHRSLLSERKATASNEPLEFLGDAVLGFVVAEMLHRRDPMGAEGDKTRIRARLVSTPTLVGIGRSFDVGALIKMSAGEEKNHGRAHDKVQEDAVEALIAGWMWRTRNRHTSRLLAALDRNRGRIAWSPYQPSRREAVWRGLGDLARVQFWAPLLLIAGILIVSGSALETTVWVVVRAVVVAWVVVVDRTKLEALEAALGSSLDPDRVRVDSATTPATATQTTTTGQRRLSSRPERVRRTSARPAEP